MHTTTAADAATVSGYEPWGMLAAVDLHDCDRRRLADPDEVSGRLFVDAFSLQR